MIDGGFDIFGGGGGKPKSESMVVLIHEEQIVVKVNGNGAIQHKDSIHRNDLEDFESFLERLAKNLKLKTARGSQLRLFNYNGMELFQPDLGCIKDKEVLYLSAGEDFDAKSFTSEYETIKSLGAGGFGRVVLAVNKITGQHVAIKTTFAGNVESVKDYDVLYNESQTLKSLKHPNIVSVLNCFVDRKTKTAIMVMEYLEGGELLKLVEEKGFLTEPEALQIFSQIVSAVDCCHKHKVIHRDLKLENILRANQNSNLYKVVDFGIAGLHAGLKSEPTNAGSLNYMAPELFTKKHATASPALDVWSLGCILYAMLTGKLPFRGDKSQDLKNKIVSEPVTFPPGTSLSEEVQHLIRRTMDKNPETRASIFEITDHAWAYGRQFTAEEKERIKQQEVQLLALAKEAAQKERERLEEENAAANPVVNSHAGGPTHYSNSPKKYGTASGAGTPSNSKFKSFGNMSTTPTNASEKKNSTPTAAAGGKKPSGISGSQPKPSAGHK